MNIKLNNRYINELLEYEKVQNGLYIVATPIGNLGDITLRSLKILSCVDLILCEDTRISKKLTNKYGIKTQLKPFHKFNSTNSIPLIIKKLQAGLSIAIISDAGTPIISDPGSDLIKICDEKKLMYFHYLVHLQLYQATFCQVLLKNLLCLEVFFQDIKMKL